MTDQSAGLYCQQLADLIAECDQSPEPDPRALERIERHLSECGVCQGAESVLSSTVYRFRSRETSGVSERFQAVILNRLCGEGDAGPNQANQA